MSLTPSILVTVQTLVVGCGFLLVTSKCLDKSKNFVMVSPPPIEETEVFFYENYQNDVVDEEELCGDRPPSTTFTERGKEKHRID